MSLLTNIKKVRWMPQRNRVLNESPFTGRRQEGTFRFNRWGFIVEYAKTKGDTARLKESALGALKGGEVSFDFRDPSRAVPSTGYSAGGAVDSSASGFTIPVKGLTVSTAIVKAGDYFSISIGGENQLFQAAADATSDISGDVTITTNNPVRGTAADDDVVIFTNWLVTVTIDGDERYETDERGVLVLPALKFIEDF